MDSKRLGDANSLSAKLDANKQCEDNREARVLMSLGMRTLALAIGWAVVKMPSLDVLIAVKRRVCRSVFQS